LTGDEVARAAGLSPFHFSRLFHQIVGLAPHQYLLRCRLQHAQQLLSLATDSAALSAQTASTPATLPSDLQQRIQRIESSLTDPVILKTIRPLVTRSQSE
jgi:AraC-like DNA-binding protein